jgi:hypothetical protein
MRRYSLTARCKNSANWFVTSASTECSNVQKCCGRLNLMACFALSD